VLDFLKRDKVKDPFGGDDLYDGESRFAGKGPKIALAASVVLFIALAGGVAAIVMTGKTTPPPVMGMLSDIEVVDEPAGAASPPPAAAGKTAPQTAQTPAPDATAATDRDIQRRPWLAAPAAADGKRAGVNDPAKPATPAPKAVAEAAKPALMTPPPAPTPAPAPVASAPPAKTPAETKAAETKPAEVAKDASKAAPVQEAAKTPAPPAAAAKDAPKDAAKDAAVADANPFGPAPGAPGLFSIVPSVESGPAVAGGRPRLVDALQPPIDKTAITAPPPRFANIVAPKKDAGAKSPAATAKIAVVINGLGLSATATDAAIAKLPASVTLAFSPYARNLKKWTEKAKAGGHEVLIEVPMESKAFPAEDPGPLGLLTTVDAKENNTRLDAILKDAGDAIGILDTEGSKFRESEPHIGAVFTKLKEKNLFYVQGEPGVRVGDAGVPTAITDVVLDERPFRAAVDARLDYAERLAKYQGSAVATLGAKPVSFERLVMWLEQAQKKGVVIAPISEVLIRASASEPAAEKTKAAAAGAPEPKAAAPKAAPAKAPAKKS
jgi:polysaccharide deacetylase 2 family uncharacterized protein YibQ